MRGRRTSRGSCRCWTTWTEAGGGEWIFKFAFTFRERATPPRRTISSQFLSTFCVRYAREGISEGAAFTRGIVVA